VLGVGQEHADEDGRGRALRRDGHAPYAVEGSAGDELDRIDGALRGDAEARQDAQPLGVAAVLDRGDRREVDLAREQARIQVGRNAGDLFHVGLQAEKERRHVHVRDASETDHAAPVHWKNVTRLPSMSTVANSRVP
jgi:hypothetical protein